eukprot:g1694.t1
MKGSLEKQSRYGLWQRRHFELHGHYLKYYKSESSAKLLAAVDIAQSTVEPSQPTAPEKLTLDFGTGKKLALRASDKDERERWVRLIQSTADCYQQSLGTAEDKDDDDDDDEDDGKDQGEGEEAAHIDRKEERMREADEAKAQQAAEEEKARQRAEQLEAARKAKEARKEEGGDDREDDERRRERRRQLRQRNEEEEEEQLQKLAQNKRKYLFLTFALFVVLILVFGGMYSVLRRLVRGGRSDSTGAHPCDDGSHLCWNSTEASATCHPAADDYTCECPADYAQTVAHVSHYQSATSTASGFRHECMKQGVAVDDEDLDTRPTSIGGRIRQQIVGAMRSLGVSFIVVFFVACSWFLLPGVQKEGQKRNDGTRERSDSDKDNGGEGGAKEEEEEEKEEHVADREEVKEQVRDDERLKAGSGKRFRFGAVAGFVTKLRNSARKSREQRRLKKHTRKGEELDAEEKPRGGGEVEGAGVVTNGQQAPARGDAATKARRLGLEPPGGDHRL